MNISKRSIIPVLVLAAGALYAAARPAPGGDNMASGGDPGTRAEIDREQTAVEPDPDLANGFDQITARPYGVQLRRQKE